MGRGRNVGVLVGPLTHVKVGFLGGVPPLMPGLRLRRPSAKGEAQSPLAWLVSSASRSVCSGAASKSSHARSLGDHIRVARPRRLAAGTGLGAVSVAGEWNAAGGRGGGSDAEGATEDQSGGSAVKGSATRRYHQSQLSDAENQPFYDDQ